MKIADSHEVTTERGTGRGEEKACAEFARVSYSGRLIASEHSGKAIELS